MSLKKNLKNSKAKNSKKKYSREQLEGAIRSVQSGSISFYRGAKNFAVPKTTLIRNVNGCRNVGKPAYLTTAEETDLAEGVLALADCGLGITRHELCILAQKYAANLGKTFWVDKLPSRKTNANIFCFFLYLL